MFSNVPSLNVPPVAVKSLTDVFPSLSILKVPFLLAILATVTFSKVPLVALTSPLICAFVCHVSPYSFTLKGALSKSVLPIANLVLSPSSVPDNTVVGFP